MCLFPDNSQSTDITGNVCQTPLPPSKGSKKQSSQEDAGEMVRLISDARSNTVACRRTRSTSSIRWAQQQQGTSESDQVKGRGLNTCPNQDVLQISRSVQTSYPPFPLVIHLTVVLSAFKACRLDSPSNSISFPFQMDEQHLCLRQGFCLHPCCPEMGRGQDSHDVLA